ncbi:MAG TPA: transcriptional regulator, partial [Desulfomicrobium sp.]|nr:transcriptional regulator [Desulfomicrobium sp.]
MDISLKYGSGSKTLELPDGADVTIMKPRDLPVLEDLGRALDYALDHPIGTPTLEGRPRPASVAIAVPDETRPAPLKTLLPVLLDRIFRIWPDLDPASVRIVVGGGLHPAP